MLWGHLARGTCTGISIGIGIGNRLLCRSSSIINVQKHLKLREYASLSNNGGQKSYSQHSQSLEVVDNFNGYFKETINFEEDSSYIMDNLRDENDKLRTQHHTINCKRKSIECLAGFCYNPDCSTHQIPIFGYRHKKTFRIFFPFLISLSNVTFNGTSGSSICGISNYRFKEEEKKIEGLTNDRDFEEKRVSKLIPFIYCSNSEYTYLNKKSLKALNMNNHDALDCENEKFADLVVQGYELRVFASRDNFSHINVLGRDFFTKSRTEIVFNKEEGKYSIQFRQ